MSEYSLPSLMRPYGGNSSEGLRGVSGGQSSHAPSPGSDGGGLAGYGSGASVGRPHGRRDLLDDVLGLDQGNEVQGALAPRTRCVCVEVERANWRPGA
jgi:hypothetical protein